MPPLTAMGVGRGWLNGLLSIRDYQAIQFYAGLLVLAGALVQLHVDRKFRWPPEPGRVTIFGGWLGVKLHSGRLAIVLADVGRLVDFAAALVGRIGIAGQGVTALFAIDDALACPREPRTLLAWVLICIVLIQARALTAYLPRSDAPEKRC